MAPFLSTDRKGFIHSVFFERKIMVPSESGPVGSIGLNGFGSNEFIFDHK